MNMLSKLSKSTTAFVMAFIPLVVGAAELEATHTLISTASDGMGLNTITLEMTITNNTASDLNSVKLDLMRDRTVIVLGNPHLEVSSVGAGSTVTVNWSLNSPLDPEVVTGPQPLIFAGEALDVFGAEVSVHLVSNASQ